MKVNKSILYLLKSFLLIIILLFISSLIINILYYFDIIGNNLVKYLKMFLIIASCFIGGIYIGRKTEYKGYISGLKLSLIISLFFIIAGIVFNNLNFNKVVFYLIIITCITFGSMIGISKNKTSN